MTYHAPEKVLDAKLSHLLEEQGWPVSNLPSG
jgi:hypothetical protein